MTDHQGNTDEPTKVELTSEIQRVIWTKQKAVPGGMAGLEIHTHYVGSNSELKIELEDHQGKSFGKYKEKIHGNRFWANIKIPEDAKDALYAKVKLPKHGLELKSNPLIILPKIEITNAKWDKKEARRGDILKLTANIKGVPDGTEAEIEIWEHDADEAHDLITKFPVIVKDSKVESEWEFEYHEDTDEIPTKEESEKGYNPPEYFFRVKVGEVHKDSELLEFKDWIEISLVDKDENPMPDEKYILYLADGSQKKGTLDNQGKAKIEDILPGPVKIEYPDVDSIEDVEETEKE